MKLVEELYEMYKNHLTGDEEDAFVLIHGLLQDFDEHAVDQVIKDLSEIEKFEMLALYLYECFRLKVADEGIGQIKNKDDQGMKYFH